MITIFHEGQYTENKHNDSTTDVLEMDQEVASTKKKKRVRRSQSCKTIIFSICFLGVCSYYNFRLHFYIIVSRFLCINATVLTATDFLLLSR
jgi:trimethylguanosine synthase